MVSKQKDEYLISNYPSLSDQSSNVESNKQNSVNYSAFEEQMFSTRIKFYWWPAFYFLFFEHS
jgi:hypothetical protein